MGTLKSTKNDAGLLMASFLNLCIGLSRDELFFWSRSEEEFKKLFLRPVSELAKLSPKRAAASKKQYKLDESQYASQLDLYHHYVHACRSMTPEQVRFWLKQRSLALIDALLRKGEINFLPAVEGVATIPALPGNGTVKTFRSKNFRQDRFLLYSAHEKLQTKYKDTEQSEASCFTISCSLTGDEMFSYIGGTEAVSDVAFTPEQIRHLASEQRRKKDKGLLSYAGSNYFPVVGKDSILYLVSLQWSQPSFPSDDKIGRWHYWALDSSYRAGGNGRLFLRC